VIILSVLLFAACAVEEGALPPIDDTGVLDDPVVTLTGPLIGPQMAENDGMGCFIAYPEDGDVVGVGELVYLNGMVNLWMWDVSDWITASWSSDLDGELTTLWPDTSGTAGYETSTLSPGTHTITLSVHDEEDVSCFDTVTLTVGSNAVGSEEL
jgi:hypothetical protein